MKITKINILTLILSTIFISLNAYADFAWLYVTNLRSGEAKDYKLGKSFEIPISGVQGWKSCKAFEPQSKYVKENNSHVRQYFIHCSSDSGASVELLCALPDEKNSHDSSSITLMSKQSNERVLLFLNCLKK
jgi:hypothetical protein